ncbi:CHROMOGRANIN (DUF1639) [Salix viminalis]|nr:CHROMOGRANIN (DUF1639) [Salix viminalis]
MSSQLTVPHQQPEIRKPELLVGLRINNKKPTGNATDDGEGSFLKGNSNDEPRDLDHIFVHSGGKKKRVSTRKEIKRRSFSISLEKEEIELDFLLLTGVKAKRKPQKRSKNVKAKLDSMFPGLRYL